jgi:hypothetical protein
MDQPQTKDLKASPSEVHGPWQALSRGQGNTSGSS